ncbi:hypothetical protein KIPB_013342, partial [Kipferlia bialata]
SSDIVYDDTSTDEEEETGPVYQSLEEAVALVTSDTAREIREGVSALHTLLTRGDEWVYQYLYFMAVGEYRLGEMKNARKHISAAMRVNSLSPEAKALNALIRDKRRA